MFYDETEKLPPASDLAEQAEEECKVERSGAKEEEKGWGLEARWIRD